MPPRFHSAPWRPSGFTIVELLVAVAILIALAALVFSFTRNAFAGARSAQCLSRIRQSAVLLVGSAGENNNRIRVFQGGSGAFEFRPYFMIRDQMELPENPYDAHYGTLKELLFCPAAPEPTTPHWNCYGVNLTNSTLAGAEWAVERFRDSGGRSATVSSLSMSTVGDPSRFVLLADSCRGDGQQIFRIKGGDRVGLRHRGKANAFFLDGSARSLSRGDLGLLGFKDAYDASVTPPTSVSLPQNQ